MYPYAEAQIKVFRREDVAHRIVIYAENHGERFTVQKGKQRGRTIRFLEAAVEYMNVPDDVSFEVNIFSEAPARASTTSAAVTVALIGALDLLTPGRMTPYELRRLRSE